MASKRRKRSQGAPGDTWPKGTPLTENGDLATDATVPTSVAEELPLDAESLRLRQQVDDVMTRKSRGDHNVKWPNDPRVAFEMCMKLKPGLSCLVKQTGPIIDDDIEPIDVSQFINDSGHPDYMLLIRWIKENHWKPKYGAKRATYRWTLRSYGNPSEATGTINLNGDESEMQNRPKYPPDPPQYPPPQQQYQQPPPGYPPPGYGAPAPYGPPPQGYPPQLPPHGYQPQPYYGPPQPAPYYPQAQPPGYGTPYYPPAVAPAPQPQPQPAPQPQAAPAAPQPAPPQTAGQPAPQPQPQIVYMHPPAPPPPQYPDPRDQLLSTLVTSLLDQRMQAPQYQPQPAYQPPPQPAPPPRPVDPMASLRESLRTLDDVIGIGDHMRNRFGPREREEAATQNPTPDPTHDDGLRVRELPHMRWVSTNDGQPVDWTTQAFFNGDKIQGFVKDTIKEVKEMLEQNRKAATEAARNPNESPERVAAAQRAVQESERQIHAMTTMVELEERRMQLEAMANDLERRRIDIERRGGDVLRAPPPRIVETTVASPPPQQHYEPPQPPPPPSPEPPAAAPANGQAAESVQTVMRAPPAGGARIPMAN